MHKLVRAVLCLILLWPCANVLAQSSPQSQSLTQPATAVVRGIVTDPSGALMPDAEVVLHPTTASSSPQTTLTARDGHYTFASVPPGTYTVRVTAAGFAVFESKPFTVTTTKPPTIDVHLRRCV